VANRKQRRAKQRGKLTTIHYGHISERDPNYGSPVNCYVCDLPHKALGIARIETKKNTILVPLCEPCLNSADENDAVIRQFLNSPELNIKEGGEATPEQLIALADKQSATEH
jgi:hypothetical protein